LNTLEFAHTIVTALEERKGEDILLLDINEISIIADYFVICSGTSPRMLDALLDSVVKDVKATYKMLPRSEGSAQSGWISGMSPNSTRETFLFYFGKIHRLDFLVNYIGKMESI